MADSMGGAGLTLIQEILNAHNCPADTIYSEASETFHGRLAEPIEKNLLPLKKALKEGDFAFGVATDGDADRVGVCLDTGEWLSAQNIEPAQIRKPRKIRSPNRTTRCWIDTPLSRKSKMSWQSSSPLFLRCAPSCNGLFRAPKPPPTPGCPAAQLKCRTRLCGETFQSR